MRERSSKRGRPRPLFLVTPERAERFDDEKLTGLLQSTVRKALTVSFALFECCFEGMSAQRPDGRLEDRVFFGR